MYIILCAGPCCGEVRARVVKREKILFKRKKLLKIIETEQRYRTKGGKVVCFLEYSKKKPPITKREVCPFGDKSSELYTGRILQQKE